MKKTALLLFFLIIAGQALGKSTIGRVTFGSYFSDENFKRNTAEGKSNDFLIFSSRFYLKGDKAAPYNHDFALDLRGKYDFYGKLDKDKQTLHDEYDAHPRQAYIKKSRRSHGLEYQLGRFSVDGVGINYVDGLQTNYKLNSTFKLGAYGGLIPKLTGEQKYSFNSKSKQSGVLLFFRPRRLGFRKYFFSSHGFSIQGYGSQTDRSFLHSHNSYIWGRRGRFYSNIVLDFVPRTFLQKGDFSISSDLSKKVSAELGWGTHDNLAISRSKTKREVKYSNRYGEVTTKLSYDFWEYNGIFIEGKIQRRKSDSSYSNQSTVGLDFPRFLKKEFSLYSYFSFRNDYEKKEYKANLALSYFARLWELFIDQSISQQNYDNNQVLRPIVAELGWAYFWARGLMTTFSYQYSTNANVDIYQVLFKLSYRFGSKPSAPLREGAPKKGHL
ncbi:MAG: hypothetical protein HOE90_21875 [Bacteriovoracaceae bacterium]|jgi:hypothetical protein|nr:hypothetical protein [Bacteriovoracaceae bacterium]